MDTTCEIILCDFSPNNVYSKMLRSNNKRVDMAAGVSNYIGPLSAALLPGQSLVRACSLSSTG